MTRELRESDLALLATERHVAPSHVQRISSRHHALARSLASGMPAIEAALCTGYTTSRISVLKADPAFQELIAHYTKVEGDVAADLGQRMATLGVEAAEVLAERLETTPESFANDELSDLMKVAADRTGHGPASRTTNVNVNVNLGDRLRAARERAASAPLLPSTPGGPVARSTVSHEAGSGPLIEGEFTEVAR